MENSDVEFWAFGTRWHKTVFAYPKGTPKKKIMQDAWDWVDNYGAALGVSVEQITPEEAAAWGFTVL